MKFKIATLGCRTNQYESQAYASQLIQLGHVPAQEGEVADLCIVNTCTVTHSADRSSEAQIRQLAAHHPGAKLVITGCMAEKMKGTALPAEATVVLNAQKEELITQIFPDERVPPFALTELSHHTRAFVKIQDGCNSFCTYCIIPYVRGRSRSRRIEEILDEIRTLVEQGYKEVVLTGINVGDFDGAPLPGEPPVPLSQLISAMDAIDGLARIRVSSIDPDEVDDALTEAILGGKKTCHSMHIVLQSGSNVILKRMNRKYTREMFLETAHRLRSLSADFTLTTDIIVGFPGESESDFQDTLDVMEQVHFAHVHMFPFSPRERTRAALYPDRISPQLITERKQRVLHLAEQHAFKRRAPFVGKKMMILTEEGNQGHTDNFLPVSIENEVIMRNQLLEVEIVRNAPEGLIGVVCR